MRDFPLLPREPRRRLSATRAAVCLTLLSVLVVSSPFLALAGSNQPGRLGSAPSLAADSSRALTLPAETQSSLPLPMVPPNVISFVETGLAAGTTWWVNVSGTNVSGTTPTLKVTLANGAYSYMVADPILVGTGTRYTTPNATGSITVNNSSFSVPVPYAREFYLTTAAAPAGAGNVTPPSGWFAAGTVVNLTESPNASYAFQNWSGSGTGSYSGTNASPSITMGGPITEVANFGAAYPVTFTEVGLPAGTNWSVTLSLDSGNVTLNATSAQLVFYAPNGTFNFTVSPVVVDYLASPWNGSVTVSGTAAGVVINWTAAVWTVTFVATGLPNTTVFTVIASNGSRVSSVNGSALVASLVDGDYTFSIQAPSGWQAAPSTIPVTVSGKNVTVVIVFRSAPANPNALLLDGIVALVIVVVAAAVAVILLVGRRKKTEPPRTWSPPPRGTEGGGETGTSTPAGGAGTAGSPPASGSGTGGGPSP